jgi:hypothetical protein
MEAPECGGSGMDDDALVRGLGRTLAGIDPAPRWLAETACELYAWRTVDAELSELLRAAPAAAE